MYPGQLGLPLILDKLKEWLSPPIFEGDEEKVNQMLNWLQNEGSPGCEITKVEVNEERLYGEIPVAYNIRY